MNQAFLRRQIKIMVFLFFFKYGFKTADNNLTILGSPFIPSKLSFIYYDQASEGVFFLKIFAGIGR